MAFGKQVPDFSPMLFFTHFFSPIYLLEEVCQIAK
jgi:hypothetical protein